MLQGACYGDMVILLRSLSGFAEDFVNILMNEGIPAYAERRTGYFTAIEVETVLCFLSIIDNPMQDIPLAAVLKSPSWVPRTKNYSPYGCVQENGEKGTGQGDLRGVDVLSGKLSGG